MNKITPFLNEIKAKMAEIQTVTSVKIGMEKGIGSKDSPFIRIVPIQNEPSKKIRANSCRSGVDDLSVQIIFGFDLKNKDLELLYQSFYDLEAEIRAKMETKFTTGHASWQYTVTDEDKLPNIKSAISMFEIVGIR